MEISKLLIRNYLPYAKSTIISRAIPSIDGLKPVQRRILYIMNDMGLLNGDNAKSQRINGQVMRLHPHGDSSIYEALVLMTTSYDGLNVPYIKGKGSFGKKFSRDLQYAAPRYTEAKLAPVSAEFFDGIKENAVDFVPNFDETENEPTLLPVKFPNILVNSNPGVAVGTSSNIPTFSLKNVCLATQGIINGSITNASELAKVLGNPEFTTGGFLHASHESLTKLCETGRGSFVISGHVEIYTNQIVIDEIPYTTTAEDIMDAIEEHVKNGNLKGVQNVRDEIGLAGLRLVVEIKRGYNSREVLQQLCRLTTLRTKVSYRTRVIIADRCQELGLLELLQHWIDFRRACIYRVYEFRLKKDSDREHLLATWEKIKHDIPGVVQMISKNSEAVAKQNLMTTYGLDEIQCEYLLEMRIRSITTDRAAKALKELDDIREKIKYTKLVLSSEAEQKKIIFNELTEIINKYGIDNKTANAPEINEEENKAPEVKISEDVVTVVVTNGGYIKKLVSLNDIGRAFEYGDEKEVLRWNIKNNQHILVFDRFGTVHKVLVDDIDSGRGALKEKLYAKAGLEKPEDMIWADACGDYTGYFNLVYPNGRGTRVLYSGAVGTRNQYKSLYDKVEVNQYWITQENQFFMITHRNKASYCDLTRLGAVSNRTAFKVARLASGDWFTKLILYKNVPNIGLINLEKYNKDYTVSIGDDILWVDEAANEEAKRLREEVLKQYAENERLAELEREAKEAEAEAEASKTLEQRIDEMRF